MIRRVTSGTRVFTLLGDPVEHSLSPVIQNAAFSAAEVDGIYVALRAKRDSLANLMQGISLAGGAGNVTLPHKERAAAVVDVRSEAVRRTGACNTFWSVGGTIHGDNTDVEGFRRALRGFLDGSAEGFRVLLLGAGGAARAALVGLIDEGAAEVLILNRTTERARAIARRIGGQRVRVADSPAAVDEGRFDLVINATRLGLMHDDPLPFDLERLAEVKGVLDLVYGPKRTPFVRMAESQGIKADDGGEMLVHQAAVAFESFWGQVAPIDAMRDALLMARMG